MIILKLLTWLLVIAGNVYADRNRRKPNYLLVNCMRGALMIVHAVFVLPYPDYRCDYQCMSWYEPLVPYMPIFLFQLTSYWVFFPLALNLVWGEHWLYYDIKEKDSGWVDMLFAWAGWKAHLLSKILAFIVMVLCVVVIAYY